jgi:hypothetical protein
MDFFFGEALAYMTQFFAKFEKLLVGHGIWIRVLSVTFALLDSSLYCYLLFYLGVMCLHHYLSKEFFLAAAVTLRPLFLFFLHLQGQVERNHIIIV